MARHVDLARTSGAFGHLVALAPKGALPPFWRYGHRVITTSLDVTAADFAAATGWEIKPEGACKGAVCVPLESAERFDLAAAAKRLRMAVVQDDAAGLWAIGPESLGDRALVSAEAPELTLGDLDGQDFRLSSLRGQKVVLVAWAPY
jgi:hypothetical protein